MVVVVLVVVVALVVGVGVVVVAGVVFVAGVVVEGRSSQRQISQPYWSSWY